ncbi:hypothetical protein K435DRAFT_100586 [Dendrothele bispora CBS 962.96]|uniref:Uncharacterized protein n=1 Tax=Dendrothele bispora (strain CBS 962.96) TaxID=1314807 RepID=A0A4S8M3I1_DENBC|nr:hypothetical protein K435DRAFT_100586 [Dendrothele bispora CBS 962.96]
METPMSSVLTDSTVIDAIDHATMEEEDHGLLASDTPTTTMTSVDVPGPLKGTSTTTTVICAGPSEPPASGASVTTVTNEQDAEAFRTVSPSTRANVIVAQSVQMLHGSSHSEFNNSQFNNTGRDKTTIVYNIRVDGNATISCPSTDLAARRISSTGSTEIASQDNMPSQTEHASHQYTGAGSTLVTSTAEENGSTIGVQAGITTPHGAQRDAGACENPPSRSCPCTQGKEDQQATSTIEQTTKSG